MSYKGMTVTIPVGGAGLITDAPSSALPINALQKAINVSVFSGTVEKSLGTTKFNSTALDSGAALVCIHDWFPIPGTQRLIAMTATGKLYRDTGDSTFSGGAAIKTGLGTITTDSHMMTGGAESANRNKKLFIFPIQSQIQILSGDASSVTDINLPSPDWQSSNYPSFGVVYQNRMIVMGSAADRHRLYCSAIADHENFVGQSFNSNRWELWRRVAATPNVDLTSSVQAGTASTIFTTTNNDGFLAYGVKPFNKLNFTVSQASTGSPVYTYEYFNGSVWASFTPTAIPDLTTTGAKTLEFNAPSAWAVGDGTEVGGSTSYYAIRVLATTAPGTAVQITSFAVLDENAEDDLPTFPVFPGEGEAIMSAIVYRGLLFIFKKPYGVYVLDGRDPNTDNWKVYSYADSFGVASPHAVAQALGDLAAANSIGSYTSLQASDAFGDFEAGDILQNAQVENYIRSQFDFSGLPYSQSVYWAEKKLLMFTGQATTDLTRDKMLYIDLARQSPRILIDTKERPNCLTLRKNTSGIHRPMYGSSNGFVYLMEQPTYNRDGSPYLGEFQTAYTDLGQFDQSLSSKNKIFDFIEVKYIPTGNNSFFVDIYIDGELRQTLTFTQYLGVGLDDFVLDEDALASDPQSSANRKALFSCMGKKISIGVRNNSSNQGFKIESFNISFRVSGEQVYSTQV